MSLANFKLQNTLLSWHARGLHRSVQVLMKEQNVSGKSGWKVNGTWLSVSFQRKISGSKGTPERVVLFFRTAYSKRKLVFHFFQSHLWYQSQAFAVAFQEMELICTYCKRDSGTKFTSPEFCLLFAWTENTPVCRCKWETTKITEGVLSFLFDPQTWTGPGWKLRYVIPVFTLSKWSLGVVNVIVDTKWVLNHWHYCGFKKALP